MRKISTAIIVTLAVFNGFSQSAFRASVEVPVQIGLGYEGFVSKRFSVLAHVGILTPPNSTLIIDMMDQLGVDAATVELISETFRFGWVGEVGVNYNFHKYYGGVFTQGILLQAGETPTTIVESYFNINVNDYPAKRNRTAANEPTLTLKSQLIQAGILFGRRFGKPDKKFSWGLEASFSMNVASKSSLSSEYRLLESLSAELNKELDYYYSNYALVPSLCLFGAYTLK